MVEFSHWDFAEQFYADTAAALILGIEPPADYDDQNRIGVVLGRMENDFHRSVIRLQLQEMESVFEEKPTGNWEVELHSITQQQLVSAAGRGADAPLSTWLNDKRLRRFEDQQFTRVEIARWLKAIGMKSAYNFDRSNPAPPARRWSWGDHHTEALGHLEAAANEFWSDYDPAQPATAPKNLTVSNWLQERGVTRDKADAIASILRADGLPTGPRK